MESALPRCAARLAFRGTGRGSLFFCGAKFQYSRIVRESTKRKFTVGKVELKPWGLQKKDLGLLRNPGELKVLPLFLNLRFPSFHFKSLFFTCNISTKVGFIWDRRCDMEWPLWSKNWIKTASAPRPSTHPSKFDKISIQTIFSKTLDTGREVWE